MQKEYKTRQDSVEKVIHSELSQKFKFNPTNKRYMHNSESALENETHKSFGYFEIQSDHLIIVNKKKKKGG